MARYTEKIERVDGYFILTDQNDDRKIKSSEEFGKWFIEEFPHAIYDNIDRIEQMIDYRKKTQKLRDLCIFYNAWSSQFEMPNVVNDAQVKAIWSEMNDDEFMKTLSPMWSGLRPSYE
jgi:predicted RNase H-like nuclease